jgi:hypothetical protein
MLKNTGQRVQAVYAMLERTLPGSKTYFTLTITPSTNGASEANLSDSAGG